MPPKSKKSKEERLLKQRLCQRRRYAEIKNDPKLLAIEKEKRKQKYLKKKANTPEKTPRAIKEQRKRWKQNSKRYRRRKNEDKQQIFDAIQIKADPGDQDDGPVDTDKINQDDPLNIISAKVKKVRYQEFKKRKILLRVIESYKKKDKAQTKKIQRLRKLLACYREKIETLETEALCSVSMTSSRTTCSSGPTTTSDIQIKVE